MSNNNPQSMPLICARCQMSWSIPAPQMEINNMLYTSVVTVAHQQIVRCPSAKCRQPYLLAIQQAQLAFAMNAISDDVVAQMEGSVIVKPNLILAH